MQKFSFLARTFRKILTQCGRRRRRFDFRLDRRGAELEIYLEIGGFSSFQWLIWGHIFVRQSTHFSIQMNLVLMMMMMMRLTKVLLLLLRYSLLSQIGLIFSVWIHKIGCWIMIEDAKKEKSQNHRCMIFIHTLYHF